MAKNGWLATSITGLKAIAGAMIHYLIMLLLVLVVVSVFRVTEINAGLIAFFFIALVFTGLFVLGWVYRSLWGWR